MLCVEGTSENWSRSWTVMLWPSGTVYFQALMLMMIMKQITPVYMYKVLSDDESLSDMSLTKTSKNKRQLLHFNLLILWFCPRFVFQNISCALFYIRFLKLSLTYLLSLEKVVKVKARETWAVQGQEEKWNHVRVLNIFEHILFVLCPLVMIQSVTGLFWCSFQTSRWGINLWLV